ncbi:biliverdin-producing heme oxygenase [Sphingomonas jatrophae]|uniref:biliverdin-producing heme oxygenase n=1 Tax=Sphingomonas jatrophae TaxID=1166337 RepID=UPI0013F4E2F7|nr:biliverdin-producing heme oxygenase [Sphingomonas jatrophae]
MSGLALRLREATRDLHDDAEGAVDWESRIATPAGYRQLIERWWGYHAAREPRLIEALGAEALEGRTKLPALAADLAALGQTRPDILPLCQPAAAPLTREQALGALYVSEGATMGGQLIARTVRERFGADAPTGFFHPYGARTGAMWQDMRRMLDAHEAEGDAIVAAARDTFRLLAEWLKA